MQPMRAVALNSVGDDVGVVLERTHQGARLTLRPLDMEPFAWLLATESVAELIPGSQATHAVLMEGAPTDAVCVRQRLRRFVLWSNYVTEADAVTVPLSPFWLRFGAERGLHLRVDTDGFGDVFVPSWAFRSFLGAEP